LEISSFGISSQEDISVVTNELILELAIGTFLKNNLNSLFFLNESFALYTYLAIFM